MFRELLGSKAMDHDNVQRFAYIIIFLIHFLYNTNLLLLYYYRYRILYYTIQYRELKKLTSEAEYGKINTESFQRFANIHQALLFNVFGIQNKLRITTLGVTLWTKMSKRRIYLRPGCVVKLSDLIILVSMYEYTVLYSLFIIAVVLCLYIHTYMYILYTLVYLLLTLCTYIYKVSLIYHAIFFQQYMYIHVYIHSYIHTHLYTTCTYISYIHPYDLHIHCTYIYAHTVHIYSPYILVLYIHTYTTYTIHPLHIALTP